MRAVRQQSFGGRDALTLESVQKPTPGPQEMLIEVRAAGVNPTDTYYREGKVGDDTPLNQPTLPFTLGSDFAGIVREVGDHVTRFNPGDRVFGTGLHTGRTQQGAYAEYIAIPPSFVAHLPAAIEFREGAAIGLAGVTAWRALFDYGTLKPGAACLIHGGSGGVGHVALQLADSINATTLTTARSDDAQLLEQEFGADRVFDYHSDNLLAEVTAAVPDGVNVVLDHMSDEYLGLDIEAARFGGHIVTIGGADGHISDGFRARANELTVHFMTAANLVERPELPDVSAVLRQLAGLLSKPDLTAHVAHTYPLEEIQDAHRTMEEDHFVGKLVITI
ncbi:alcohol dehydrogenase GroES domain-containing protein [Halococcus morrhuae DSM 1307]|uniref:Alcohol dehydrogenase GroES domain-containing protein n=2 Tax=Halococcus morrhuae TaxID=2250 RepID=M0MNA9_HALMO|nr:alcohol dehydrogenase GroES domain-containing protein [Halococcus morrhuae DSM 1307]